MSRRLLLLLLLSVAGACGAAPLPLHHVAPSPAATASSLDVEPDPEPTSAEPPWFARQSSRRVVTSTSITILDRITFIGTTAELDARSTPILDAVAMTLDGNPSIRLMEVQASGAYDDVQIDDGQARTTTRDPVALGELRAQRVIAYLVDKGVAPDRLRAQGVASLDRAAIAGMVSLLIVDRD